MDNKTFKNKCNEWLRDEETVSNVQWIMNKTKEPVTVTIEARIRKKIIDGSFIFSQSFFVRCTSLNDEIAIQNAVLATNKKVVELVQDDSVIWKAN